MVGLRLYKIKKVSSFVFFLTLLSCNNSREINFYKKFFKDGNYITKNESNALFITSKSFENKVFILDLDDLDYIYNKDYSNTMSLESFINRSLNQTEKLNINEKDFPSFIIDQDINADFIRLKEEVFLSKYTIKSTVKNRFIINTKRGDNKNKNVAYQLFKKGYSISFDDYSGFYYAEICPNGSDMQ